mgnify:CR=1 FL=1
MTLSRRTLLYTLLISLLLLLFFAGYLILLLPGLYVDHVNRRHVSRFEALHLDFVASGTYNGIEVENPISTLSFVVPMDSDGLRVYSPQIGRAHV